jgi:DNA repair protein RecN (Recombination protein N)
MLRMLRVSDLAIIDELEIEFEPGLNVVTGETGAGKSILLHALDAALGGRPDADVVRTGATEAVVEALFTDVSPGVRTLLASAGLPIDRDHGELLLRRVIGRGGRTRAYVNATLGSVGLLRDLGPQLLRVYGQDEHQALRRVESHREMLDATGGLGSSLDEMARRYDRLTAARQALADATAEQAARIERRELLQFQLTELKRAALVAGEDEQLTAERNRLQHAERLRDGIGGAERLLGSGEPSASSLVHRALLAVKEGERLDSALAESRALLEGALADLQEAARGLERYVDRLAADPERLDHVDGRLTELNRLKRKYGSSVDALMQRRDDLEREMQAAAGGEAVTAALAAEVEQAERAALEWAKKLSVERRRVASNLERGLAKELRALALEDARFKVQFAEAAQRALGPTGFDELEFLMTTNPGEDLRPLARIASGGELSRIMLALKSLAAADDQGAALIFDEVDAGIGGSVAETVGRKLQSLGRRRQVLCVTHLPVIAAFADYHVAVSKQVLHGRTVSTAKPLSTGERVVELARMLSGQSQSREARDHAQQLLRHGGITGL